MVIFVHIVLLIRRVEYAVLCVLAALRKCTQQVAPVGTRVLETLYGCNLVQRKKPFVNAALVSISYAKVLHCLLLCVCFDLKGILEWRDFIFAI